MLWPVNPYLKSILHLVLSLFIITSNGFIFGQKTVDHRIIEGQITAGANGEPLAFADVFCISTYKGTQSDEFGWYKISVPDTSLLLEFRYLGFVNHRITVGPGQTVVNVELKTDFKTLREVEIIDQVNAATEQVHTAESGIVKMKMSEIEKLPAIGGEVDIIKVVQLLPGVTQGGEGGTSLFVRGGDADQNLILYDDATLYSVSHLFGFFSVFNPDILDEVTLYKGGFPARYGGRLSSILDIQTRDGSFEQWGARGGVGLLSSRLAVDGPVVPGKVSILLAGRRAYIDRAFKAVGFDLPYYFYDLNGKVSVNLSPKDRFTFSAYYGYDVLKLSEGDSASLDNGQNHTGEPVDFGFKIGNYSGAATWSHSVSPKLESIFRISTTSFNYRVGGGTSDASIAVMSNISDIEARPELIFRPNDNARLIGGMQITHHTFEPNIIQSNGDILDDDFSELSGEELKTWEGAAYVNYDHDLREYRSRINLSLRQSFAATSNKTYTGIEPRFNYRFLVSEKSALKVSYALMRQYMHRVSSSNVILPTDLWYPVTDQVLPQKSHQVSLAWEQSLGQKETFLSIEGYMKWMYNLTEYREGANLIMNNNFENELVQGNGTSRGIEVLLKRNLGNLTGWIGYSISQTDRQFSQINNGEAFPARYDRRHNGSVALSYALTKRLSFSTTWVFLSGSRFTALLGNYFAPNPVTGKIEAVPVYSKRNEIKLSDSHRLDVNFRIGPNLEKKRRYQSFFNVGAYNVYARALPYRVNITPTEQGKFKYTQPGLFGFIFNMSYEFKF